MHLAPREIDKLLLHQAGCVAQKRHARGLQLNYVETVALISAQLLEFIREGDSVATLMDKGKKLLGFADVMPGVADMLHEVQVEGTFPDGTKLVTVHHPICRERGEPELALYGSGLHYEPQAKSPAPGGEAKPGEILTAAEPLVLNANRATIEIKVTNRGDRPVQVGSHYPFFETNALLDFDRAKSFGMRLDIPAGTAVRFEPGETKTVQLVALAGENLVRGGNNLTDGVASPQNLSAALSRAKAAGFSGTEVRHG